MRTIANPNQTPKILRKINGVKSYCPEHSETCYHTRIVLKKDMHLDFIFSQFGRFYHDQESTWRVYFIIGGNRPS